MSRIESFPPIVSDKSKVLILGSMPGEVSLKAGEYYAHRLNVFWDIMGELFGAGRSLPYQERTVRLQAAGVALWDALQACVRSGSLDASITLTTEGPLSLTAVKEYVADARVFREEDRKVIGHFFRQALEHVLHTRSDLPAEWSQQYEMPGLPSR
jgi:hypoxanthine-DNA glycosylase